MDMRKLLPTPSPSISKNQKRECHHSINDLPDEMLISIVSHMPMKEATTTSILSRRWERLWTYNPRLVFDGSNQLLSYQHRIKRLRDRDRIFKVHASESIKFVNEANRIIGSNHAPNIEEFKIHFNLYDRYQSDVDEWVRFAFGKEVKMFELDLSSYQGTVCANDCYKFCTSILGSKTPNSLTSLVLKQVNVTGEVVENIIHNNPFLRCLCIGGSRSLVDLRVVGPSICLTYLEIISCICMKSLELDAPDLLSLKYTGHNIDIRFVEVPKLVELCMGDKFVDSCVRDHRLPLIETFASHLLKLVLTLPAFSKILRPLKRKKMLQCPGLTQLKHLELKVIAHDSDTLLAFSSLIDASPSLNRFALELIWLSSAIKRETKELTSHHHNLKVVEITGYIGRRIDTEFCRYLIRSAVTLEKISIDPLNSMLKNPAYEDHCNPERLRAARERAGRLRSEYDLEDKLVIL